MTGILFIGFLIGMRHALEADHVAAVAVLTTRTKSLRQAVPMGAMWGVGHTLTLFVFGSAVLFLDAALSDGVAGFLEAAVGGMLVVLGGDVLIRLIRERIHFHAHRHAADAVHLHAHSHKGDGVHQASRHGHEHPARLPRRALLVGMMHGMAGSAALVLLTVQTVDSVTGGLAYIGLFGLGSIIGMGLLTAVIILPLKYAATSMTWAYGTLTGVLGAFSVGLGLFTVFHAIA